MCIDVLLEMLLQHAQWFGTEKSGSMPSVNDSLHIAEIVGDRTIQSRLMSYVGVGLAKLRWCGSSEATLVWV